eukprot:PRCOL_00006390-RA
MGRKQSKSSAKASRGGGGGGSGGRRAGAGADGEGSLFDRRFTKNKFSVLGRKVKGAGDGTNVARRRSEAQARRSKTLLDEFRRAGEGRRNAFDDRRLGERDRDLAGDEDAKAMLRFQRLRAGGGRKARFALGEDDEGGSGSGFFTHNGRALGESLDATELLDGGGEGSDGDEDDLDRALDGKLTDALQFGGGYREAAANAANAGADPGRQKTKREVMAELIAKSKAFKHERQKLKEEDEELRNQLDETFRELAASGALAKGSSRGPMGATPRGREVPDEFDKQARALGMEARGHAGNRTKTAEEVAEERRERLEELEAQRQRRMRGDLSSDDEDGADSDGGADGRAGRPARKPRKESGDALDENFEDMDSGEDEDYDDDEDYDEEAEAAIDARIAEALRQRRAMEAGAATKPLAKAGDGAGEPAFEQDDSDSEGAGDRSDAEAGGTRGGRGTGAEGASITAEAMAAARSALPFTIAAPATYKEFAMLVRDRPASELAEAIERIRACTAVELSHENRRKLQSFYGVLLSHYGAVSDALPLDQPMLDAMVTPLLEMTAQLPLYAATAARAHLLQAHTKLCDALEAKGGSHARWPARRTMLMVKLWCMAFPVSDARHPVVTPVSLLLGHALCMCPLERAQHAAHALFCAQLATHMATPGGRLFPEAIVTLAQLLEGAAPEGAVEPNPTAEPARRAKPLLRVDAGADHADADELAELVDTNAGPAELVLDFGEVMDSAELMETGADADGSAEDLLTSVRFRLGATTAAAACAARLAEGLRELPSAAEALEPLAVALRACEDAEHWPVALRAHAGACAQRVQHVMDSCVAGRVPLRMFADRKAVRSIKQFTPRFEEDFNPLQNYDPDRERADAKKMKRQIAKEARGAARELRKDNHFLADAREERQEANREEIAAGHKRGRALLEETETAWKTGGGKRKKASRLRDLKAAGKR